MGLFVSIIWSICDCFVFYWCPFLTALRGEVRFSLALFEVFLKAPKTMRSLSTLVLSHTD